MATSYEDEVDELNDQLSDKDVEIAELESELDDLKDKHLTITAMITDLYREI